VDHRPFFRPGLIGRQIDCCIEMALIFKCSPYEFLGRDPLQLAELYKRTHRVLESLRRDDDG
jgi:hypothetical protein